MKLTSLLVFVFWSCANLSSLVLCNDNQDIDEDSLFMDINNRQSFAHKVLQSNDSWILVFNKNTISKELKHFAIDIRGLAWIGTVDVTTNSDLQSALKLIGVDIPVARVYPFGGTNQKLSQWQDVATLEEAREFALKSIPNDIPVLMRDGVEKFIAESHMTDTPRYPTVYLTDSGKISPVFRAIRERFRRYVNLGVVLEPTPTQLSKLGFHKNNFPSLPALAVIIRERIKSDKKQTKQTKAKQNTKKNGAKQDEQPKYNTKAILYNTDKFGDLSYSSIMQFFFSVNHQFRYTLQESRTKDSKITSMMSDIMDIEEDRFDELFGRKKISKSQKAENKKRTENKDDSNKYPEEKQARGGKCPFGFDKMGKEKPSEKPNLKKDEL